MASPENNVDNSQSNTTKECISKHQFLQQELWRDSYMRETLCGTTAFVLNLSAHMAAAYSALLAKYVYAYKEFDTPVSSGSFCSYTQQSSERHS